MKSAMPTLRGTASARAMTDASTVPKARGATYAQKDTPPHVPAIAHVEELIASHARMRRKIGAAASTTTITIAAVVDKPAKIRLPSPPRPERVNDRGSTWVSSCVGSVGVG